MAVDFQFQNFVAQKKGSDTTSVEVGRQYAYSDDLKALEALRKLKPVTFVVESSIKMSKSLSMNNIVGNAVKVTPRQFAKLYAITEKCADALHIEVPDLYVAQSPYLNASTYGTTTDSFILLHSALVDHFTDDELAFVIGHECGHIQNGHVMYLTAAHYVKTMASTLIRWAATPATVALNAWSRRAEITCDRAALITTKDIDLAVRCMIKLAVGSQRLYEQINPEEYLKQLEESQRGLGRLSEALQAHPYYPKRVEALRLFAESEYYQSKILRNPNPGTKSLEEVDAAVSKILSVI
jgi:Zn-dependent protease with chaperone function